MNRSDIENLFAYNRWANSLILDAAAVLTDEQFKREVVSSYPSMRDTLTHILASEWIWLRRCFGESPNQLLDPRDFPDLLSLRKKWAEADRDTQQLLANLQEESLESMIAYTNLRGEHWKYPLIQILQHMVNHSTYHRGQATTLLRTLGAKPAETDYLIYVDVQSKQ